MKLNQILAAALVAAASVPAMASIGAPLTGNGELFLVVWDQADTVSYTKDLGILMDDFAASSTTDRSFALDDAFFTGFLAAAATTPSDLKFAVIAGDGIGTRRIFTTIDSDVTFFNNGSTVTASGYLNNYTNYQFSTSANTNQAGPVSVNGTSFDTAPNLAYFGAQQGFSFQGASTTAVSSAGGTPWTNSVLVGTSAKFRSFSSQGTGSGTQGPQATFDGLWTVANVGGTYTATYAVAAVPEADGIAMALAGFGALGFMARRRRAN